MSERNPERAREPVELEHAERHLIAARAEWQAGKFEMAAMHLREGICDAAWSLYALPIAATYP